MYKIKMFKKKDLKIISYLTLTLLSLMFFVFVLTNIQLSALQTQTKIAPLANQQQSNIAKQSANQSTKKFYSGAIAKILQDSECLEIGELSENYFFNKNTNTWWIDLDVKAQYMKENCNPACVISIKDKTAEVNWRCTGLVQ